MKAVFRIFILCLIVIPAIEIFGLIMAGRWIGGWQTLFLVIVTGLAGAYISKREGLKVWHSIRSQWALGHMPTRSVVDGLCILLGGVLLLTPGFFTDLLGLLLVLPFTRVYIGGLVFHILRKYTDRYIIMR